MTLRDLVVISTGNLWRMKLRTFLTTSGVLIAIAAFIAMLSFGAGNQEHITAEFNKLGLFSTMNVYPKNREKLSPTPRISADSTRQLFSDLPPSRESTPSIRTMPFPQR